MISNASDALDKIRLISLTDENALAGNEELTVKIKVSLTELSFLKRSLRSQAVHQLDTVGYSAVKSDLLVTVGLVGSPQAACGIDLTLPIFIRFIGTQSY